ncbi:hypothetical protein FA09DRAFT_204136 [Tilletiopsis washingtonensis]|uniref:Uncharacterized protein n=1 Tax=Tilletiopsis washingtonensis TaxID=58919 RepID=A0A316ZFP8_9BASI|nr:hypothetical protein FA09DRAFT_204136 [Tilletiopsis washingtonensis]PWO00067.1 hypothetical protein FA09DRAFT_204136 [Tilletiopsis washingtonensis]
MRVPSIPLAPALLIRASLAVPHGHRLGAGVSGMAGARSRQRRQLQRKGATHSCVHERQQAHARRRRTGGVPAGDHTQRRTPPIQSATGLSTALASSRSPSYHARDSLARAGHSSAAAAARCLAARWRSLRRVSGARAAAMLCRGPIGDPAFECCTWLQAPAARRGRAGRPESSAAARCAAAAAAAGLAE